MSGELGIETTTLFIFVALKVRRHLPQSYSFELRSVLALYQKPLREGLDELLTFYSINEEIEAD